MKIALRIFITLLTGLCLKISAIAQNDPQIPAAIVNKLAQQKALFNQTKIFLHIDKSVYTPNENIWFKSYLLKSSVSIAQQHTLFVFLSERKSGRVALSDKFIMEDGMAAGSFFIPDSIKQGEYNLIAYTNTFSLEKHPVLFQQSITVRTENAYTLSFENAALQAGNDSSAFICKIRNAQKLYPKNAQVLYRVRLNDSLVANGQKIVNDYGEISASLPASSAPGKLSFDAIIVNGKDSFHTGRKILTAFDHNIRYRWFPEGGRLTDGLSAKIAFEATTFSGKPAVIIGTLYEDDAPVAKLQANAAGLGVFELKPKAGRKYSVRIAADTLKVITPGFPLISEVGYSLSVENGVAYDMVAINIRSKNAGDKVHLMVHDYQDLFAYYDLTLTEGRLLFKIPVADMPPGMLTLTLLDSAENPCAERTIIAGIKQIPELSIRTDSSEYHKRSKVKLRISIKDAQGNAVAGACSFACVYKNRIDTSAYQSIVPYSLFSDYFQHGLMDRVSMYRTGSKEEMEMMLLARCRAFFKPAGDPLTEKFAAGINPDVTGYVLRDNGNIKAPVKLTIISSSGLNQFYTDSKGVFTIPAEMLAAKPDEKLSIIAGENGEQGYNIIFHKLSDTLQLRLATLSFAEPMQSKAAAVQAEEDKLLSRSKTLETAVVKSKTNDAINYSVFKSTTCHDWVCMYNVLNCENHPTGGRAPVEGEVYYYHRIGKVVYHGCVVPREIFLKIKGRYYSREFYKADYAQFNAPDPELQSTVYWQPDVITNDAGEADIDFYTNDLAGSFLIIVQGVTEKGTVSGIATIRTID